MVYDFPLSVPSEMTDIATRFLKSWYGLARPAEVSILYRSRAKHGLQLTSFLSHYKAMRVCRAHLAKHSPDPVMRQLYNLKLKRAWQSKKPWSAPIALEEAEAEVDLEEKFPGQSTKHGLGFIRPSYRIRLSTAAPSADHRTRVLAKVRQIAEEQSLVRVYGLALAGNWLKLDGVMQQDLSWTAQLHNIPEARLKFLLNSIQLSLPTPSNLRLWGKSTSGRCALCGQSNATLLHILAGCVQALDRYTWRHNLVLYLLLQHLPGRLRFHNRTCTVGAPRSPIRFVKEGQARKSGTKKLSDRSTILQHASDWMVLFDLPECPLVVPPLIIDTPLRPDILIWSGSSRVVLLVELTCPWEENLGKASARKRQRYSDLADAIRLKGWKVHVLPIEVGCRGFVAHSFRHFLTLMAFPRIQLSTIAKRTSQVTLQASYLIFKARHGQAWHQFDLVSRPSPGALRQLFPSLQSSAPLPLALQSTPTEPNISCPALELP